MRGAVASVVYCVVIGFPFSSLTDRVGKVPSFWGRKGVRKEGKAGLERWRVLWVDTPSYFALEWREKIGS